MANSIQELMNQLGSMNYSKPSSYTGYKPVNIDIGYKPVNLTPYNFTQDDFKSLAAKKKKKVDAGVNLWDVLSGTLGQAGGVITHSAYKTIEDLKDPKQSIGEKILNVAVKDNVVASLIDGVINGGKQQFKNWTDGKTSWGDVPGVGFLHGADKGWKRGTDIMEDFTDVDNKWGKVGGGIAIDIALDPLTYLTGGFSAASKLGKAEELKKIGDLSKGIGLTGKFKNADEFSQAASQAIKSSYVKKFTNPATGKLNVSQRVIDKAANKKLQNMLDEINVARNTTFNKHINDWGFAVPFTNKVATVGKYGSKNLLHRTEAVVPQGTVDDLLRQAANGDANLQDLLEQAAKARYGVGSTGELSKTMFEDLHEFVQPVIKQLNSKGFPVNKEAAHTRSLGKQVKAMENTPYNKAGNFKTNFEHTLDKKNIFDARTLATGDKFINSMGDHIADANSRRFGESAKYSKDINAITKFIKKNNITDKEMREAIYHVEGKAPKSYGHGWVPSQKVQSLSAHIQKVVTALGKDDSAAGVLSTLRKNYFPHVIKKSDDEIKAMIDFDRASGLNGLSQSNKFDQSRKSFNTIADLDNYIETLVNAIRTASPEDTAKLEQQLERVENLFETNIVTALTRRVREGVRARAMKGMNEELAKYGMFKTIDKNSTSSVPRGLKLLDKVEAKKLGLGEGYHYMHPDVLQGLKRVDEIFTDQGMNKFVRHISAIADAWKPLVTYYKPAHYINNAIGNSIINMAAGVTANDYKAAGKLLVGLNKGTLTPSQQKVIDVAYKHNIISGDFLVDSGATYQFDTPTKLEEFAKKVADNRFVNSMKDFGSTGDDVTRLANFINGINKFGNTEKAAQQVRKYLFNYSELTNADRKMKVVVPFWNWMKNNIPLQMKMLMEQPKFAVSFERFQNLFNEEETGQEWQKESGIKIPFTNRYTQIPSPSNDLNSLLDPLSMLGSLNPAIKMPLEAVTNRKLLTGQPISYGEDKVQAEDLPAYTFSNLGILNDLYKASTGEKSVGESLLNLLKPTYEAY